jgi:CubicO group peptidase (beta-lactamase class C family)
MPSSVLREGSAESVGMDPARIARLKKLAAGWVSGGDTPSLALLVARRGTVVLHEAFGVRRHDDTTPTLRTDSIFPVSSIAKPVTAAAVMCLVEDGLIGLNRPFIEYIPELDGHGVQWLEEARVADLLCHTSGFDDVDTVAYIEAAAKSSPALPPPAPGQHPFLNARIRLAAGAPLKQRPGAAMVYCGFGYNLLGDIVRRVSGQPFWQFVQSRIFQPLGMKDSYFGLPPELRGRRVYRTPGMPATEPPLFIDSPERDELDNGSGGLATTARDLAAFAQMLLNKGAWGERRVLSPASVAAMTRNQVAGATPAIVAGIDRQTGKRREIAFHGGGYGFGLFIFGPGDRYRPNGALASNSAFGHTGIGGAYFWADPERDLVGVYLGVSPRYQRGFYFTNADLFQNAVNAAILDQGQNS